MAFSFTNTNSQYITGTLNSTITYPLTFAAWFNCAGSTGSNQTLVSVANTSNNDRIQLVLGAGASLPQVIQIALVQGATSPGSWTSSTFTYNTWNHAAAVMSNNTSRIPYLNAVTNGTTSNTAATPSSVDTIAIGARLNTTYGLLANAKIADVGIWSAALNASELVALSKGIACYNIRPNALIFYAPLIRNLVDLEAGISLTNNNNATITDHPRTYL